MNLRYFKNDLSEFACKETGNNLIEESFVHALDDLRDACGFPFVITSGYRDPSHSAEINKSQPGQHCLGIAADIAVSGGAQRFIIVKHALAMGFSGVGTAKTFVHVDLRETTPMHWSY